MAEFRLLGLVEIWSAGRRVPVGQPRQRLVLAALLVDAGRPVSPESLVQRVWGDAAPEGARHAIHEYLTRIRRALAQIGTSPVRLTRRGGVYVLDVDPDQVDLHLLRRLVERAREPGRSDPERVDLLRRALDLWRGEPLADLSGEWVEWVREGARPLRLDAATMWAQAQLRSGHPAETIQPLAELLAEHPLAEPVAMALMRALHASGRTVEALDCYAAIRKRLVADVGTEPGSELQEVHQSILRGPPPAAAPAPPAVPVPAQLPAGVRGFAGRNRELSLLDGVPAGSTVGLSGTAGVGKTALAVHWAHRVVDRFPDGQLYVNLRGFDPAAPALSPAEAIRGFLDALEVPPRRIPAEASEQAALYRSLLADRRMLVLLDNARDAEQVRPLLPDAAGCLVLVTSRSALAVGVPLALDVLTGVEAHHLLIQRLGRTRVAAEPDAVTEIVARCARLPLALSVVAARAAVRPNLSLAALARQLRDMHERLDTLSAGDPASDVRAVFSWSYDALSPPAATLFRLLGLHAGPDISAPAAASLAGEPRAATTRALAELVEANLLSEHGAGSSRGGRYAFHDLLRTYAAELADVTESLEQRRAALHRVLDHYLQSADTASELLGPARDSSNLPPSPPGVTPERPADVGEALAWFTAEHRVLLAAIDQAASTEFNTGGRFDTHVWLLAYVMATYLRRQVHWHDCAATQRSAVAAAARLGDPNIQARTHRRLGDALISLGQFDEAEAELRQALHYSVQANDLALQAHTQHRIAAMRAVQRRYPDAIEHARQALELFRAADHGVGQANTLTAIGWYYGLLGEYEPAVRYCQQGVQLQERFGDDHGQAAAWDSLGYAQHHRGHHTEAITCYEHSLRLMRGLGDRYSQAVIVGHLADAQLATGDVPAARASYAEALTIFDDLGHPDATRIRARLSSMD